MGCKRACSLVYDPEPTLALLQAEVTELVKIALGSLENNEAENQRALDGFNLAAVDRSGAAAAIFEVRLLETGTPDIWLKRSDTENVKIPDCCPDSIRAFPESRGFVRHFPGEASGKADFHGWET